MPDIPSGAETLAKPSQQNTIVERQRAPQSPRPWSKLFNWAFTRKPKAETPQQDQNLNLDTSITADANGKIHIDKQQIQPLLDASLQGVQKGFNGQTDADEDALLKALNKSDPDNLIHNEQNGQLVVNTGWAQDVFRNQIRNQLEKNTAESSNSQNMTDEDAWRKMQGNYPPNPHLLEQAQRHEKNHQEANQNTTDLTEFYTPEERAAITDHANTLTSETLPTDNTTELGSFYTTEEQDEMLNQARTLASEKQDENATQSQPEKPLLNTESPNIDTETELDGIVAKAIREHRGSSTYRESLGRKFNYPIDWESLYGIRHLGVDFWERSKDMFTPERIEALRAELLDAELLDPEAIRRKLSREVERAEAHYQSFGPYEHAMDIAEKSLIASGLFKDVAEFRATPETSLDLEKQGIPHTLDALCPA